MKIRMLVAAVAIALTGLALSPVSPLKPAVAHAACNVVSSQVTYAYDVIWNPTTQKYDTLVIYLIAYKDTCDEYMYELEVYDPAGNYVLGKTNAGTAFNTFIRVWVCGNWDGEADGYWPSGGPYTTMYVTTTWIPGYGSCGPQADDRTSGLGWTPQIRMLGAPDSATARISVVNF